MSAKQSSNPTPPNPLPCGCKAKYEIDTMTGKSIYVVHCPLHEAAEDLLTALDLVLLGRPARVDPREWIISPTAMTRVRAAIAKARPAKVERAGEKKLS